MPDDVDDSYDDIYDDADDPADQAEIDRAEPQRVSRWDRPKEPHDWRWGIGVLGRTLITIGLLMFAFVGYQLWGTGIQTAREQDRLGDKFGELLETTTASTTSPSTTGVPTTQPETSTEPETSENRATTTAAPTTSTPPPAIAAPTEGDPVARLDIPRMDLEAWTIVEGVGPDDLADGPGHFPETPLPGQLGNAALAGHRTTHGEPFRKIDRLQVGDEIVVTTLAGQYIYIVTGTGIVDPNDYASIIPTVDPERATLTLTSCHPPFSTKQRYVVFSELDLERSSLVTLAADDLNDVAPAGLPGEDRESPDQSTATTAESIATVPFSDPSSSDPSSSDSVTSEPVTTDSAPSESVAPTDDQVAPPSESTEVFANEWFSDPAAFPHVAIWGLALISVIMGAYAVARRARRMWVGVLVGFAPLIVVLYFFFENVSRLLPPNV